MRAPWHEIANPVSPRHGRCDDAVAVDTTIKKIDSSHSPRGRMGEIYLASGKSVAMRLWREEPREDKEESERPYETVGYVIRGRAELVVGDQTVTLAPGDSWVVPRGTRHRYRLLEPFEAVEATSPPAHVHGRDAPRSS